jgi:DNA-binding NarL/FixJ family response regulator
LRLKNRTTSPTLRLAEQEEHNFVRDSVFVFVCESEGLIVSKIRVLLADDHGQMLEYVSELLWADGCEVVGAVRNGQGAVDAATQLLPDVAVLDISMPVLDGIQAARRIQEAHPSIKIVFLTMNRDTDICRAALETGALAYVLKQRLGTDLIPALKLAIAGRRFVSPGCERNLSAR